MQFRRILSALLALAAICGIVLLLCPGDHSSPSTLSYKEAIFREIAEMDVLDPYIIHDSSPLPMHAEPGEIEEHAVKRIRYEENEYLVSGYRFHHAKDALRFFQNVIKKEAYNEDFDPEWMPFTWYSGHEKGVSVFGLIAQRDVLRIESSTADLEALSKFQNWLASNFTKDLSGAMPENAPANE